MSTEFIDNLCTGQREWEWIFETDFLSGSVAVSAGSLLIGEFGVFAAAPFVCNCAKKVFSRALIDLEFVDGECSFLATEVVATAFLTTVTAVALTSLALFSSTVIATVSFSVAAVLLTDTLITYLMTDSDDPNPCPSRAEYAQPNSTEYAQPNSTEYAQPNSTEYAQPNRTEYSQAKKAEYDPTNEFTVKEDRFANGVLLQKLHVDKEYVFPHRPDVDIGKLLTYLEKIPANHPSFELVKSDKETCINGRRNNLFFPDVKGLRDIIQFTRNRTSYSGVPDSNREEWYRDFQNILAAIVVEIEKGECDVSVMQSELIDYASKSNECAGGWRDKAVDFHKALRGVLIDSEVDNLENTIQRYIVGYREALVLDVCSRFTGSGAGKVPGIFGPHLRNLAIETLMGKNVRFSKSFMLGYDPLDTIKKHIPESYGVYPEDIEKAYFSSFSNCKLTQLILERFNDDVNANGVLYRELMEWAQELCEEALIKIAEDNKDKSGAMIAGLKDEYLDDFLEDLGFVKEEVPTLEGLKTVLIQKGFLNG